MGLDRSAGDVEPFGDVGVAVALRGEGGDVALGRRECVDAGERGAAGTGAGGLELGARAAGEEAHALAVGEVEGEAQRRAGVVAAVGAAQGGAEIDEGARVLELRGRVREQRDGALEQDDPLVGIAGVREGAQARRPANRRCRGARRARGALRRGGAPRCARPSR